MFDIVVDTTFSTQGQGGEPSGAVVSTGRFGLMTFSDPPTQLEIERLAAERWHTRPDWWIEGRTPKNLNDDVGDLPAGWSYASGTNILSVSGTVTGIDGWDFAVTETLLQIGSGDDIAFITNCKFASTSVTKADRIGGPTIRACILFDPNTDARIQLLQRNWFTAGATHLGGFGAASLLQANKSTDGGANSTIDVMEYNSFEGYGADAMKGVFSGIRRYNYFDCPLNVPSDSTEWSGAATYNTGDCVYNSSAQYYQRMCTNDGVTNSPDWSSKNVNNTNWVYLDPHSDLDQALRTGGNIEWQGNFFNRRQNLRRYPSRIFNIGVVHALFYANGLYSSIGIRDNIFTEEIEARNSNTEAINTPGDGIIRSGETITITGNYHEGALNANGSPGSQTTQTGNISGWTAWAPATLSGITAIHGNTTDTLAYQFTPTKGGWMTVVVSTSASTLTAAQIIETPVGGAILAKFEIDAEAGVEALGFVDLTLTTGQTVYAHALYQAGGGIDTIAAVQTVTEGAGTSNTFAMPTLVMDGYVFDRNGSDYAPVVFSGNGKAGDQVQVRGASAGGNTGWHSTFVRSDGTWTTTAQVPLAEWGNWYAREARYGTNDGTKLTGSNTFGCGDVVAILGQSELQQPLDPIAYRNQITKEIAAENLSVVLTDDSVQPNVISTARVTAANMGGIAQTGSANVSTIALANAFHRAAPDRKIMIVDLADSGSSPFSLWNDADSDRRWVDLEATLNTVRASGSDIGAMMMYWVAAPRASLDEMLDNWAPGMFGQMSSGAAFTLGNINTEAEPAYRIDVDHCFWDITAAADQRGRGVFARNRTKLWINHIGIGNDADNTAEAMAYENVLEGAGQNVPARMNTEVAAARAFAADSRVQTFWGGFGAKMGLVDYNENNTAGTSGYGGHPNRFSAWGMPQGLMCMLPGILRQAGVAAVLEPRITGTSIVNATTVDVTVDLPNGGNLSTIRTITGTAHTVTPDPGQQQAVTGFQIDRVAGTKRPIFRTAETGYPSLYRGTVTIQNSGTGTAPNRTGTVRIVLTDAIATGDRLTWADGLTSAQLKDADKRAHLWMDYLIEHVPAWYDSGALYPYYGEPIVPQPTIGAL